MKAYLPFRYYSFALGRAEAAGAPGERRTMRRRYGGPKLISARVSFPSWTASSRRSSWLRRYRGGWHHDRPPGAAPRGARAARAVEVTAVAVTIEKTYFMLMVADMDRAVAFYRDALGLAVEMHSPGGASCRVVVPRSPSTVVARRRPAPAWASTSTTSMPRSRQWKRTVARSPAPRRTGPRRGSGSQRSATLRATGSRSPRRRPAEHRPRRRTTTGW
jgi:hypothetical protein